MSDYDDGFEYGYEHPHKISGWTKSVDWNKGFRDGKKKYFEEQRELKEIAERFCLRNKSVQELITIR